MKTIPGDSARNRAAVRLPVLPMNGRRKNASTTIRTPNIATLARTEIVFRPNKVEKNSEM